MAASSANRINEAHRAAIDTAAKAMLTGIERAIEVGRLLAEEKTKHEHGEWIPWIEENLEFNRKQASAYMRAYDKRDELSNVQAPATFGLQGALRLLATPREKPKKQRQSPRASVEVSDSDDDDVIDLQGDDEGQENTDDDSQLGAYLIRADQAARFAFYKGSVSKDVIAMARRVADAWTKLADRMEDGK
jgi:hypothetical protein